MSIVGIFITTVLFPPLKLPRPTGPYSVGVIDTFLPKTTKCDLDSKRFKNRETHVAVRILYPADASKHIGPRSIAYQPLGSLVCDEFMRFGAPGPLKSAGFLLQYWLLIRLPFLPNAPVAEAKMPFPVTVYSHGLGGSVSLYSVQAGNLASNGHVVIMVQHADGSAPLTRLLDGTILGHEKSIYDLRVDTDRGEDWDTPAYVKARRDQIEIRVHEVIEASRNATVLNAGKETDETSFPVNFKGRLDLASGVNLVGHSFGGATVLGAAGREPDLFRAVSAHDPAIDWVPDDVRYSILKGSGHEGSGGFVAKYFESPGLAKVPIQMIYCDAWVKVNFGHHFVTLPRLKDGSLGAKGSQGEILEDARHFEFSDNTLIQPLWLSKALMFCGSNPDKSAKQISDSTTDFLSTDFDLGLQQ